MCKKISSIIYACIHAQGPLHGGTEEGPTAAQSSPFSDRPRRVPWTCRLLSTVTVTSQAHPDGPTILLLLTPDINPLVACCCSVGRMEFLLVDEVDVGGRISRCSARH